MILLFFCFIHSVFASHITIGPTINIDNGKIQGLNVTNIYNTTFYAFLEIPYAVPPVGDLRLQPSLPAHNWDGVLNVTRNTKTCWEVSLPHIRKTKNKPDEDEDCLYLNVYTPQLSNYEEHLPVLVFIYGGNFASNHAWFDDFDPQLIVDNGVVVVTFNFRSGPLGFLSTGDGVIPENLGLKDQRLVLRWVQKNIRYFGGDASKVTLMGHSSGAISVAFHLLNRNSSEGLFRSAIIQSGTALTPSSVRKHAKFYAYELGKKLSPDFTDKNSSFDLLNLLKNSSASDICNASLPFYPGTTMLGEKFLGFWSPVIEHEDNEDPIVTGPMYEDLFNGNFYRVPTLMGITSEEILFYVKINNIPDWAPQVESPEKIVKEDSAIRKEDRLEYGRKIKSIYTNTTFQDNLGGFYRFLSDAEVGIPVISHADLQSKFSVVYFYQFSYYGEKNVNEGFDHPINIPGLGNAGHAEERNYLFLRGSNRWDQKSLYSTRDLLTQDRMIRLWTNFIKYTNPTPKQDPLLQHVIWPTVKAEKYNFSYLDIDDNFTVVHDFPREFGKWKPLIEKYYKHPIRYI